MEGDISEGKVCEGMQRRGGRRRAIESWESEEWAERNQEMGCGRREVRGEAVMGSGGYVKEYSGEEV